jgi:hypothetical protein
MAGPGWMTAMLTLKRPAETNRNFGKNTLMSPRLASLSLLFVLKEIEALGLGRFLGSPSQGSLG